MFTFNLESVGYDMKETFSSSLSTQNGFQNKEKTGTIEKTIHFIPINLVWLYLIQPQDNYK